jgi:hypothetical protein
MENMVADQAFQKNRLKTDSRFFPIRSFIFYEFPVRGFSKPWKPESIWEGKPWPSGNARA